MKIEFGTSIHAVAGFGAPGKPFLQVVAEAAETGYKHMMLLTYEAGPAVDASGDAPNAFVNVLQSDLDALMRTVASHGLRISSVYPGFGTFDLSKEGIPKTIEKLRVYRDIAWRLGAHQMVHPAGAAAEPHAKLDQKKAQIEALAQIMDGVASDKPGEIFRMAADVHYGSVLMTVADCEYFLKASKVTNAGLCLNMGHLATSGENGWELLERHPDRVHVLAWKDHMLGENLPHPVVSVELGKGETPFRKYIDVYRRVDCDGIHLITFEDVPMEEKKDALRRSREHMEHLFQEAEMGAAR